MLNHNVTAATGVRGLDMQKVLALSVAECQNPFRLITFKFLVHRTSRVHSGVIICREAQSPKLLLSLSVFWLTPKLLCVHPHFILFFQILKVSFYFVTEVNVRHQE